MNYLQEIEERLSCLPNKDIKLAQKFIYSRDFDSLLEIIDSDIYKAEQEELNIEPLYELRAIVDKYNQLSTYVSDYE